MAIEITHLKSSTVADAGDTSLVRPSDWNADHVVTGVRELLTADRHYYVRADGSDSNDGLTNSAGGAWLTLGHASNYITGFIDLGTEFGVDEGNTIHLHIGPGTFSGTEWFGEYSSQYGIINIVGNGSTGVNKTTITSTGGFLIAVEGMIRVDLSNCELLSAGNVEICYAEVGILRVYDCVILVTSSDYAFSCTDGGSIIVFNGVTVSGANVSAVFNVGKHGTTVMLGTLTISGTPAISSAFARVHSQGLLVCSNATFSGSATGNRYYAWQGGYIVSGGNTFPGDTIPTDALTEGGMLDGHLGLNDIEFGETNDTTLARYVAGTLAIEGVPVISAGLTVNATTTHTIALADSAKRLEINASSDAVLTIPSSGSVNFPDGSYVNIVRKGAGVVSLTTGTGVTLLSKSGARLINPQYGAATIYKSSANSWIAYGDLTTV